MSKNNGAVLEPVSRINPADFLSAVSAIDDGDDSITLEDVQGDPVSIKFSILDNPDEAFEQHLAAVESFDSAFGTDPLKDQYLAFGNLARAQFDSPDDLVNRVKLGAMGYDLMCAELKLRPAAYSRKAVTKKLENAFRLCGVPDTVKTQDILKLFWVCKLDISDPGEEGKPRTFVGSTSNPDWYGGNLSVGSVRRLAALIVRQNKDNELDVFDYEANMEAFSREMIETLRRGELTNLQLAAMIACKRKILDAEIDRLETLGKSQAQLDERKARKDAKEKEAKFVRLKDLMNLMGDYATNELDQSKEDVAKMLVIKGIIPPYGKPTIKELARTMTPGDAKGLIQCLAELVQTDPTRVAVLQTLISTSVAIHNAMSQQSAKSDDGQARKRA